ncbi:hypothetical protein CR513_26809, partial [Mucuna pruriens]
MDDFRCVVVWVRISRLPIEYYDKHILWAIGNVLGQTLKVESNNLNKLENEMVEDYYTKCACFELVSIEIDLRKTLNSKFNLNDKTYRWSMKTCITFVLIVDNMATRRRNAFNHELNKNHCQSFWLVDDGHSTFSKEKSTHYKLKPK